MIPHQNHHRTMEWHYDVTMDNIMMSEVIMTSHRYHYSVAMKTLVDSGVPPPLQTQQYYQTDQQPVLLYYYDLSAGYLHF